MAHVDVVEIEGAGFHRQPFPVVEELVLDWIAPLTRESGVDEMVEEGPGGDLDPRDDMVEGRGDGL